MNLLYANDGHRDGRGDGRGDGLGAYPPSWYAATTTPLDPQPELRGQKRADVCIVGGGYTGLSTALHLAQAGVDVALIEAHRVGFGASGRNGGQVGTGHRQEQDLLEKRYGLEDARKFWQVAEEAKALVKSLIATHEIDACWQNGIAHADWRAKEVHETHAYADKLRRDYGYDQIAPLDRDGIRALIGSDGFVGGAMDWGAGHIHPLRFVIGLAQAALKAGVRIFEGTEAHHIGSGIVRTDKGQISAEHIVMACNGYHGGLNRKVAARVMPINNYVIATEPLGARAKEVLAKDIAVADSKFVVNYWRLSHDQRLIFGGAESYGDRFPKDIAGLVRKPMLEIYPHLADVQIDYAWGGTLAITPTRLPDFSRPGAGLWSASGYSGHGVALATFAGKLMSDAIRGDAAGFDLMTKMRPPTFPGLGLLRSPLLSLAMRWFVLRDRFGI